MSQDDSAPPRYPRKMTVRMDEPTARVTTTPSARDHVSLNVLAGPSAGALYVLELEETTIGRDASNSLALGDAGVSSLHARIARVGSRYVLHDENSTNGTFILGERIDSPRLLADGDRIQLGQSTVIGVRFQDLAELEAARQLYESVVRDVLTGVYNRRHFDERLSAEWAYAVRHRSLLALIMIDVDYFKKVNDTHGHLGGDAALRSVGATLRAQVRTEDIAARYGGEEFVVLARGIDDAQAVQFAERLRRAIETSPVTFGERTIPLTASFGTMVMSEARLVPDPASLVAIADAAVYRAKHEGRNRVCAG